MNTCYVKTDVQIYLGSSSRNEMGLHYQEMWAKVLHMKTTKKQQPVRKLENVCLGKLDLRYPKWFNSQ